MNKLQTENVLQNKTRKTKKKALMKRKGNAELKRKISLKPGEKIKQKNVWKTI